jgi:hypothetical protein
MGWSSEVRVLSLTWPVLRLRGVTGVQGEPPSISPQRESSQRQRPFAVTIYLDTRV